MGRERSRSPIRVCELSAEEQEAFLTDFAQQYWLPPDVGSPPWTGSRGSRLRQYRERLVAEVEKNVKDLEPCCGPLGDNFQMAVTGLRWQRFVFLDDLARMSDVLFRGPILAQHAHEVDARLHLAWRKVRSQIPDLAVFARATANYRVSAVRVAMMLETGRPSEAAAYDGQFQLPDPRTLSSLLSLRCEKDEAEELAELYRLLCQKLQGTTCTHCHQPFDEGSSAGLFDGDQLAVPVTVPKVLVPQCGHAIHTLCFGSQVIPDDGDQCRGRCRRCGVPYAWTGIDVEPMVNAFCMMFGPYVDKRSQDMIAQHQLSSSVITSISQFCVTFSLEIGGLISPSSSWQLLSLRHSFAHPEMVQTIGEEVLRLLTLPEDEHFEVPMLVPALPCEDCDCEDRDLHVGSPSEEEPEPDPDSEPSPEEDFGPEPGAAMLSQLVQGCDGDSSINGLMPTVQ
mmetsp:Transcript_109730/g.261569  ORF Transcript_109730/g.261569 Transcript_109730/m.261569 type:complete len:452 (+) Transcript_109730:71-1426(+)